MAEVIVNDESLKAIGNSIRKKNGTATTYKPGEMAGAIDSLPSGGGGGGNGSEFTKLTAEKHSILDHFTKLPDGILDNTYIISDLSGLFTGCRAITEIPYFESSGATNVSYMFSECKSLTAIPNINIRSAVDLSGIFQNCRSLRSIPDLHINPNLKKKAWGMFNGCCNLEKLPDGFKPNGFTVISYMFKDCKKLKELPDFPSSDITDIGYICEGCESLKIFPYINTSNVIRIYGLCKGCTSLETVPELDFRNLTYMDGGALFEGCPSLKNLGGFKGVTHALSLSDSPLLTHQSLLNVITNLGHPEWSRDGVLTLGDTNKAKLTPAEIKIATDKGWTIK